jgi:molecular chaperone DnaK
MRSQKSDDCGLKDLVLQVATDTAPDRKLTRSIVTIQDGRLIVGEAAYRQLNAAPENTICSIKRLMGRGFNDAVVQNQLQHFSYKVTASSQGTDNSLAVWLDSKEYAPEDISAAILRQVLDNAEAFQAQTGQNRMSWAWRSRSMSQSPELSLKL